MSDFDEVSWFRTIVRRNKIVAEEVVDIGVRAGTPTLYRAFPKASFLLVDPQKGGEDLLLVKPQKYEFLNIGLGARHGKVTLNEQGGKSSILDRTAITAGNVRETYECEISTLDTVIGGKLQSSKIGVKIDTEGYELEVVKGLNEHCERVAFIVAEVSVRKRFFGSYLFDELIFALKQRGFAFYTIVSKPNPKPFHHDVLFLPFSHPMLQ